LKVFCIGVSVLIVLQVLDDVYEQVYSAEILWDTTNSYNDNQ
jgi:hypothetical protein